MQLHDLIAGLGECSPETMIFAKRIEGKFRPESEAVLLELSEPELSRKLHDVAAERAPGMEYFLEVFIAMDMLQELRATHSGHATDLRAIVEAIISYAENDA